VVPTVHVFAFEPQKSWAAERTQKSWPAVLKKLEGIQKDFNKAQASGKAGGKKVSTG
jgi:catalase (peroxidase I)